MTTLLVAVQRTGGGVEGIFFDAAAGRDKNDATGVDRKPGKARSWFGLHADA